jgi:hypothetical protein
MILCKVAATTRRRIYSSYFKLQVCWLSSLTPVTYQSKLLGIRCVAAFLQLELFRVWQGQYFNFGRRE